jgi:hypothetical protein
MRTLPIIAVIIGCILGYGYWHSATHSSFHIDLYFKNPETGKREPLPDTEVLFLDAAGPPLAEGRSDDQYSYVHLIHPVVGDCHDVESAATTSQEGRTAWQECFAELSTWTSEWADQVRQVDIKSPVCQIEKIPVTVSEYNSEWYLWWVPLPHVGGRPYTYYSLDISLDKNDCRH